MSTSPSSEETGRSTLVNVGLFSRTSDSSSELSLSGGHEQNNFVGVASCWCTSRPIFRLIDFGSKSKKRLAVLCYSLFCRLNIFRQRYPGIEFPNEVREHD